MSSDRLPPRNGQTAGRARGKDLDRLIHMLLQEELGGRQPPDLCDRILVAAGNVSPRRRGTTRPRPSRRLLAAAAVLLACGVAWWLLPAGYPQPRMRGLRPEKPGGAVYLAAGQDNALELGGYCRLSFAPQSRFALASRPFDEQVYLYRGEVHCRVDRREARAGAAFAVRTDAGSVRVTGTEFLVRVIEPMGAETKGATMVTQHTKRMLVKVLAGVVVASGAWGEVTLSAEHGPAQATLPRFAAAKAAPGDKKGGKPSSGEASVKAKETKAPGATPGAVKLDPALAGKLDMEVSVDFDNTPLADACKFLTMLTKVRIACDKRVGGRKISLRAQEMQARRLVAWLATLADTRVVEQQAGLLLVPRGKGEGKGGKAAGKRAPTADKAADAKLLKRLHARRVSLQFKGTPLADVLTMLSQQFGVNFVCRWQAGDKPREYVIGVSENPSRKDMTVLRTMQKLKVNIDVQKQPLDKVLGMILRQAGYCYEVRNGAVLVSPAATAPGKRGAPKTSAETTAGQEETF